MIADVRIADIIIKGADVKNSSDGVFLWLTFQTEQTLGDLACMLDSGNAPTIEVMEGGKVTAVYMNHALNRLQMEVIGGKRQVEATFSVTKQATPEDGIDAVVIAAKIQDLEEEITVLKAENAALEKALTAIEEGIADA